MSGGILSIFSSRSFIVSGLTFRSLIHFEFIFVYGIRKCSNFILLHVAIQFSSTTVEEAVFAPLYTLTSFVKDEAPISYLWDLYLVLLVYISVFVSVPCCLGDGSFVL